MHLSKPPFTNTDAMAATSGLVTGSIVSTMNLKRASKPEGEMVNLINPEKNKCTG